MVIINPPGGGFSTDDGLEVHITREDTEKFVHWRLKWIPTGKTGGPSFEGRYPADDGHPYEAGYELTTDTMGFRTRSEGDPLLYIAVPGTVHLTAWASADGEAALPENFIDELYEFDDPPPASLNSRTRTPFQLPPY
eukprot:GEMP01076677.1.p1 GENE.GEMP01076677.1~~GEMP01076677.1.p1  ORF type:complete len:137 (-),score=30.83 GEMP01076677.1:659-1069(-)